MSKFIDSINAVKVGEMLRPRRYPYATFRLDEAVSPYKQETYYRIGTSIYNTVIVPDDFGLPRAIESLKNSVRDYLYADIRQDFRRLCHAVMNKDEYESLKLINKIIEEIG